MAARQVHHMQHIQQGLSSAIALPGRTSSACRTEDRTRRYCWSRTPKSPCRAVQHQGEHTRSGKSCEGLTRSVLPCDNTATHHMWCCCRADTQNSTLLRSMLATVRTRFPDLSTTCQHPAHPCTTPATFPHPHLGALGQGVRPVECQGHRPNLHQLLDLLASLLADEASRDGQLSQLPAAHSNTHPSAGTEECWCNHGAVVVLGDTRRA